MPLEHQLAPYLKPLRLSGILDTLEARTRQATDAQWSYIDFLSRLLQDEVERRAQKQLDLRVRCAPLNTTKTLDTFDFNAVPSLNRQLVLQLASCDFIRQKHKVLVCGQPGWGKPSQNTTPISLTLSPEETVTIIDPRQALYGRTLPLLGIINKLGPVRCCLVWIAPGVERVVPLSATDRAQEPPRIFPACLDLTSAQDLLTIWEQITAQSAKKAEDESHRASPKWQAASSCSPKKGDHRHRTRPSLESAESDTARSGETGAGGSVSPSAHSRRAGGQS